MATLRPHIPTMLAPLWARMRGVISPVRVFISNHLNRLAPFISPRHFAYGMMGVGACLAFFGVYTVMMGGKTMRAINDNYASLSLPLSDIQGVGRGGAVIDITEQTVTGNALAPAPITGLFEVINNQTLPKISDNGATPFHAYKRPMANITRPIAAIAVRDFGLSADLSNAALAALPAGVTFILSPYADNPAAWQTKARAAGHEVWLEFPIQTRQHNHDTGAYTLMDTYSADQNTTNAYTLLSLANGYAGIALYADDALARQPQSIIAPLQETFKRGLGVLALNAEHTSGRATTGNNVLHDLALSANAPFIETTPFMVHKSLDDLELMAKTRGFINVVLPPFPKTIDALASWIETFDDKNMQLAPVSAIHSLQAQTAKDIGT